MKRFAFLISAAALSFAAPAFAQDAPDPAYADAVSCAAVEALLSDAESPPMDAATYAAKAEAILDGTDPKLADYAKKKVSSGKARSISQANSQIGAETRLIMNNMAEESPESRLSKFNACAAQYGK